ncbi:hypothetical protein ACFYUV_49730 [Nonomuraea sp. NPDC003560]|uniref:hypothetical protein n=1 Tax=Nonomuraea sp. NPDC003560 TaxID=3364341 RepID=UPI00368177CA
MYHFEELIKVALSPALALLIVITIALVEKWFGPTVGGLLQGTPIVAFPVMLYLSLSQPAEFFSDAAVYAVAGVFPFQASLLVFVTVRKRSTAVVVGLAILVWVSCAIGMSLVGPIVGVTVAMASFPVIWLKARRVCRRSDVLSSVHEIISPRLSARAGIAFVVVFAISLFSRMLDSGWTGLAIMFPTTSIILLSFNHAGGGYPRVIRSFTGINTTVIALAMFLLCCAIFCRSLPSVAAVFLALLTSLAFTAVIVVYSRRRTTVSAR